MLTIIFVIVTSVIKSVIMDFLIKLQIIIAKAVAGLVRNTRITLIPLRTQEQSNTMLAETIKM